ncbi:3' terminal RNA ribose 2'-O-methyltransferase Hen1 [Streptomyces sp. NPDC005438]|uniref:3' terminal RNA ribose 2'-O-methyltransferase Hen1 n=1 Tax=Streptomyces sp. NPDC005438 TaxID=3156880 RepID=UPI0033B15EE7
MFLTLSTTGDPDRPATDLGYVLHKHPHRVQEFPVSPGRARVFYPEADDHRCTMALLLEVDPVALVRRGRGRSPSPDASLAGYVNDRPYAASSLLAVALAQVLSSALRGQCRARPELASRTWPLTIEVPSLPARGGPALVRRLFEPLGWEVAVGTAPLDPEFPEWGDSGCLGLTLTGEQRLSDALRQLYVLLPVLDAAKHYWIGPDEVDKLLRAGEGWLEEHPEQRLIARRYLMRRHQLTRQALERLELARLAEVDDTGVEELDNAVDDTPEEEVSDDSGTTEDPAAPATPATSENPETPGERAERPVPLARARREAVLEALRDSGARRVLDLGCGQGQLLAALLADPRYGEVVGVDVSMRALRAAERRLRVDRMSERLSSRLRLLQGSLVYTDSRLRGYDAAVLCEVIEHLDEPRLPALEYAVFGTARPTTVIVTTPNVEYNVRYASLPAGTVRHRDHRFEWDRARFADWARAVAARHGYHVRFRGVGEPDPEVGTPTQLALFRRDAEERGEHTDATEGAAV